MKFNKKYYPLLQIFEKKAPSVGFNLRLNKSISKLIASLIANYKKEYEKNIKYISKPILEFTYKNVEKLTSFQKDLKDDIGVLLLHTNRKSIDSAVNMIFYQLHRKLDACVTGWLIFVAGGHIVEFAQVEVYEDGLVNIQTGSRVMDKEIEEMVLMKLNLLVFMQHAELETKIIHGKKNRKVIFNKQKYLSEIDLNIHLVDSTYYTTIIRKEGFKVKGHLRMQRYGPGRSLQRMIYIQPFEKHGYTRRAKIAQ